MADIERIASKVLRACGLTALLMLAAQPALGQTSAPPLPAVEPAAGEAVPVAQPRQVRVALVNLKDAAAIGVLPSNEPVRTTFRHTFGAERKTPVLGERLDPNAWAADVVLIQGFTSLRETRKLFPARGWKLVMSRQLVEAQSSVRLSDRPPATAIAIRHRLGLRIAGQELRLDAATGTAVRVMVAGAPIWFLSAAPTASARQGDVEAWLDAKRALREQTVVGGPMPAGMPRDRGAAAPFAPRLDVQRPKAMPVLLSQGERRLVGGKTASFARFPAADQRTPCSGRTEAGDAIVVDQQIGDRLQPDSGGWVVTLRKPLPPASPVELVQGRRGSEPRDGVGTAGMGTAGAAQPEAPAMCVLILDLGV